MTVWLYFFKKNLNHLQCDFHRHRTPNTHKFVPHVSHTLTVLVLLTFAPLTPMCFCFYKLSIPPISHQSYNLLFHLLHFMHLIKWIIEHIFSSVLFFVGKDNYIERSLPLSTLFIVQHFKICGQFYSLFNIFKFSNC